MEKFLGLSRSVGVRAVHGGAVGSSSLWVLNMIYKFTDF